MATLVIDEKSTGAKKMLEFLKTQPYIKIIEDRTPSPGLAKSIREAKTGKVKTAKSGKELLEMLKK